MIFYSLECRWFLSGTMPGPLLDRLNRSGHNYQTEERRDYYLHQPDIKQTGIKMREGQAEYKIRVHNERSFQTDHYSGQLQYFKKWSFDLQRSHKVLSDRFREQPEWIPVDKKRWLSDIAYKKSRCSLEFSNLQIGDSTWWSICFEQAVKNQPEPEKLVELIKANNVLQALSPNMLARSNSMSYPEHLSQIIADR